MSRDQQIAALELLQRIKQQEIDRVGKLLSQIRSEQNALDRELQHLNERSLEETRVSTPEAMAFIPGFLEAIERRRAYIQSQLNELELRADDIEKRLMSAFVDSKANQTVLDSARQEIKAEEDRQQDTELSEIAQNIYLRRRLTF
jgi:flagellar export protein FliJ